MKCYDHLCRIVTLVVFGHSTLAQESDTEGIRPFRVGQPVKTTSGTVIGHPASIKRDVSEYLGIRYAKEASGPQRFAAPQPFTSDATYAASSFVRYAILDRVNMLTFS
jgi:hypothetical protein